MYKGGTVLSVQAHSEGFVGSLENLRWHSARIVVPGIRSAEDHLSGPEACKER